MISQNGAPISLLDRDRMCGEWFYIEPGQEIAIFSAEHDRFIKITYEEAADADILKEKADARLATAKDAAAVGAADDVAAAAARDTITGDPIIIWRPFQCWNMSSAILCRAGAELGNTFRKSRSLHCPPARTVCSPPPSPCKTLKLQMGIMICNYSE